MRRNLNEVHELDTLIGARSTLMTDHQLDVEEMHHKMGKHTPYVPTPPSPEESVVRARLVMEEALELCDALGVTVQVADHTVYKLDKSLKGLQLFADRTVNQSNLADIAKECADVIVVTTGTASVCGIKMKPVQEAVDANNLAKFGPGGYLDSNGKWQKPPGHKKPDIMSILKSQGLQQIEAL